jgi:hypothetical protein
MTYGTICAAAPGFPAGGRIRRPASGLTRGLTALLPPLRLATTVHHSKYRDLFVEDDKVARFVPLECFRQIGFGFVAEMYLAHASGAAVLQLVERTAPRFSRVTVGLQ